MGIQKQSSSQRRESCIQWATLAVMLHVLLNLCKNVFSARIFHFQFISSKLETPGYNRWPYVNHLQEKLTESFQLHIQIQVCDSQIIILLKPSGLTKYWKSPTLKLKARWYTDHRRDNKNFLSGILNDH
jgi:hypothetical protein